MRINNTLAFGLILLPYLGSSMFHANAHGVHGHGDEMHSSHPGAEDTTGKGAPPRNVIGNFAPPSVTVTTSMAKPTQAPRVSLKVSPKPISPESTSSSTPKTRTSQTKNQASANTGGKRTSNGYSIHVNCLQFLVVILVGGLVAIPYI